MRALHSEPSSQGFQVSDKLVQAEGGVRGWGTAVATQVVGDALEIGL